MACFLSLAIICLALGLFLEFPCRVQACWTQQLRFTLRVYCFRMDVDRLMTDCNDWPVFRVDRVPLPQNVEMPSKLAALRLQGPWLFNVCKLLLLSHGNYIMPSCIEGVVICLGSVNCFCICFYGPWHHYLYFASGLWDMCCL